jgi:KRAB domain-containing zinc finger protein
VEQKDPLGIEPDGGEGAVVAATGAGGAEAEEQMEDGEQKDVLAGTGKKRKGHVCDICNKAYSTTPNLKRHKMIHTGEKPHRCDVCDKSFLHPVTLKTHKMLHTGEKLHSCDVCDKSFARAENLKIHKVVHTGEKPYRCDVCDKSFAHAGSMKYHKLFHTGEKPHRCDVCDKSFSQASNLKVHKRIHTVTVEKSHFCKICNKSFAKDAHLKIHMKSCSKKPFPCSQCGLAFSDSKDLVTHKKVLHRPVWQCTVIGCGAKFAFENGMKNHRSIHGGGGEEKRIGWPHSCDLCGKSYSHAGNMKRHSCVKQKQFPCSQCDLAFSDPRSLLTHKKILHRPVLQCSAVGCDAKFAFENAMKNHKCVGGR